MYRQTFTINTRGFAFPLDMLRYDHCFPATEMDSSKLERSLASTGDFVITLQRYVTDKARVPTWARWRSFGVEPVETSLNTKEV